MADRAPLLDSRFVESGGRTVHSLQTTAPVPPGRPAVVLVHGFASCRYMAPLALRLAPNFPVHAPDLPGFGRSANPDGGLHVAGLADALADWMTAVGLDRAVLVANSFGGQIAVELAARHPDRVEALVLQGLTGDPLTRDPVDQALRWLLNALTEDPAMRWGIVRHYDDFGLRQILTSFGDLLRQPVDERLPQVRAPALVVRGSEDEIMTAAWARSAAELLPRGRLIEMPGAAHTLNYSHSAPFARVIRTFLGFGSRPGGTGATGAGAP
jgi:pimeloyl-ACP methyl ester carboxylesterase